MEFKQWLILESSDEIVLMKTVNDEGSQSIKKDGFKLQASHARVASDFKNYGDTASNQMYGPGLYFTVVPAGKDPAEYAKENCKLYSQWGSHIVFAKIKPGSRGLVTGYPENDPMWKYIASKESKDAGYYPKSIYYQLEALGVNDIIGYKKNEIHTREEWGYKLHDKIDFWAHFHWAEGGVAKNNVVVYNPSILQPAGEFECETGNKSDEKTQKTTDQTGTIDGTPYSIPNDQATASQTLRPQGGSAAPKVDPFNRSTLIPQPEGPVPPNKRWSHLRGRWIDLTPQPQGPVPKGKVWDKILGRWEDAPKMRSLDDDDDDGLELVDLDAKLGVQGPRR
jgi:hypothetical protein